MESTPSGQLSSAGSAISKLGLALGKRIIINLHVQISAQVHTSAQLQFGDISNKTERTSFVINFEKDLERIF